MWKCVDSPYRVPFKGKVSTKSLMTAPPKGSGSDDKLKIKLQELVQDLDRLQRVLYADNRHSLLVIFQAMDAAGKDSTIRAVMRGVDPTGCQVFAFKKPTTEELEHDFLWRCVRCLPERGRIGIFNRSYYEEVLVVRVHPELLAHQQLPRRAKNADLWAERFDSIRGLEQHLARNGTVILKFWLNVSKEEQRRRFLSRLQEPSKNWKFAAADVLERRYWPEYMKAYQITLAETSRPWAPWYVIPADNKAYMQVAVAKVIVDTLKSLKLKFPVAAGAEKERFAEITGLLEGES